MLKDFFYLQRNDRQALMVLLGVIVVCVTLVISVGHLNPSVHKEQETQIEKIDASAYKDGKNATKRHPLYYKVDGVPHELFPFDPNTADSIQLLRLGLQAWQVRSIYRYRAKGGCFRKPSDFARLYGLTKKQYEVLAPYIIIGEDYRPAADYYGEKNTHYEHSAQNDYRSTNGTGYREIPAETKTYSYPQKLKPGQQVDANSVDSTELMKIPGIGSYYAKTIIRYREQLGGFASISQLREIDGFPESALSYIHINPHEVRKLYINKLTLNQLRKHPYINFYQAKEICDYRRLKGPIHSLQDLKLLKDFPPAEIDRLTPYIDFNDN